MWKTQNNSQCLPTSPPLMYLLHTIFIPKAAFYDSRDLNRFLAVLPSELACDVILWTYDRDDNPDDFYFSVDLDLSTFCNDGGSSDNNIKWKYDATVNTAIATRDINAGEEILCDYGGDYEYENGYQYKEECE
jgi:hypothetical protein